MCEDKKRANKRIEEFRRKLTHDKSEPKGAAPKQRPRGSSSQQSPQSDRAGGDGNSGNKQEG